MTVVAACGTSERYPYSLALLPDWRKPAQRDINAGGLVEQAPPLEERKL
jgi:hypothetical protein